ncbi:MAG: J domain-containing protein [Chloroflexota bacterium]|nr:J domain-containing protein [Chloroflexota bacterium]
MEYKDYYKILGVDRNADEGEIKRAYRRLARKYHPDVNDSAGAEERFKEINEAYQVLSDPEKRRKYDQLGANWRQWQGKGATGGFDWSQWTAGRPEGRRVRVEYGDLGDLFGQGGMGGFSDFFESIFGGMGGPRTDQRMRTRGQDYEQPVEITLEEAFHGTTRILQRDGQRLEVKIPPGVKTGSRVRMAGQGGLGMGGGPRGDLYLKIKVLPHSDFEREGDDLYRDVDVDLHTAVLGGEVRVPTLDGGVMLKIPPETSGGRVFRLRGKGMPKLRSPQQRGDLYVTVHIRVPHNLTAREKELFSQLARLR